ncbi:MAG TPA: sugar-binding protein, partial [Steroidobacteraceae bacterium]|nr:sugar-binding protein [Steroidobacteraceae bacterium]
MKKYAAWIASCAALWSAASHAADSEIRATELPAGEHIVIDGRLDDPAWRSAQVYKLAFKFSPSRVEAEIPETTYRIIVDDEFLYVGVDCRDPNPKAIHQELSHRDLVEGADSVKVWIDPDGRRKFAQIFKIAAGGAIWDGTHYEDSGKDETSPDFAFEAASHVHERGWSAEFKIPASSLRLNGHGQPTILVSRYYPRAAGFVFASTDIDDRHQCILCKNPPLTGLANMKRGSAVTITPYTSVTKSAGDFGSALKGRAGVDVKWRVNDSAVVDATVYPDFSQV